MQADHVNRALIPAFYRFLQAEGTEKQIATGKEFDAALNTFIHLLERAEREVGGDPEVGGDLGLWMADGRLGWVDLMAGPCKLPRVDVKMTLFIAFLGLFRTKLVLSYYRGYQFPSSEKLSAYLDRLFAHPVFKRTISTDQLYIDSYER